MSAKYFAPIELDGSLYFNSWPEVDQQVELAWQNEKGEFRCILELPPQPEVKSDSSIFDVVELRDVECK